MNAATVGALVRHVLTMAGGYMAALGISGQEWEAIAGGIAAIVGVLWSMLEKRQRASRPE